MVVPVAAVDGMAVMLAPHVQLVWVLGAAGSLLAGHVRAQFGFGVVDQLSADVHGHAVDGAGELERAGVVVGDRGAGVGAAGERAGVEDERVGEGASAFPVRAPSM
jgi:hypothetical protein